MMVSKLAPIRQVNWELVVCLALQENIYIFLPIFCALYSDRAYSFFFLLSAAGRILTGRHQHR
jgi:hypothetical protein